MTPSAPSLWWYVVALLPIVLLILAPLEGWVAGEVIVLGAFLLLVWLFSLAFAIYARMRKPRMPRP